MLAMPVDNTRNVRPPGPLAKALALLITAVLLVLGFMFSLLVLAFVAAAALLAWCYLWWKTRELRRRRREQAPTVAAREDRAGGSVFEGEAVRVDDAEGGSGNSDSR